MIATCENCGKEYETLPSWYARQKHHYCSKPCFFEASKDMRRRQILEVGKSSRFKAGHQPSPNRNMPKGNSHYAWKGQTVGYRGLHYWLIRQKGKPTKCVDCGTTEKRLQWSNVDGEYRRNVDDYVGRCSSCHKIYDLTLATLGGSSAMQRQS